MIVSILLTLFISNLLFIAFLTNKLNDLITILFECLILIHHTISFIFDLNSSGKNQLKEKKNIKIYDTIKDVKNLDDLLSIAINKHKYLKSVGKRKIIQKSKDQLILGEYEWNTYNQVSSQIYNLHKVLSVKFKLRKGDQVVIMANSSQEWLITFFALLKLGVQTISIDKKLDDDTISKILNQLNRIKCIFTESNSTDKLDRFYFLNKSAKKTNLIIYEDSYSDDLKINNNPNIFKFDDLFEEIYTIDQLKIDRPINRNDIAIILFTTDSKKGVIFTHSNLIESIKTYINFIPFEFTNDDTVLCYLPLSHSFELIVELTFFTLGVKLAYARSSTLFYHSKILTKSKSDLQASNVTILPCVPLILDRIKKQIKLNLKTESPLIDNFYDLLFKYNKIWSKYGYKCELSNEIFFDSFKKQLCGKLKHVLVSGALPIDTQIFIKLHLNVQLTLVYATTESLVCCLSTYDHTKHSNKMNLIHDIKVKINDWEEGNYTFDDKPNQRGELIIGSKSVSIGYLNNEEETEKYFDEDDTGLRWFSTGDIVEIYADRTIKIIDCKRDLVKLHNGYCISLSKLEKIYNSFGFVNNIVLHANLYGKFLIAIIQPKKDKILKLPNVTENQNLIALYEDDELKNNFLKKLQDYAKSNYDLTAEEIVDDIKLCNDNWQLNSSIESNNFISMSKRSKIYSFYKDSIDKMYLELDRKFEQRDHKNDLFKF